MKIIILILEIAVYRVITLFKILMKIYNHSHFDHPDITKILMMMTTHL